MLARFGQDVLDLAWLRVVSQHSSWCWPHRGDLGNGSQCLPLQNLQHAGSSHRWPSIPIDSGSMVRMSWLCRWSKVILNPVIGPPFGDCPASILIARTGNGLFTCGVAARWGDGSTCLEPSVGSVPYDTEFDARKAAFKE